jgi:hypothetical protein
MFILWIKKRKSANNPGKDKEKHFLSHDEDMRKFRAEHPDTDMLDPDDTLFTEENSLLPVHKVKLSDNIQN